MIHKFLDLEAFGNILIALGRFLKALGAYLPM